MSRETNVEKLNRLLEQIQYAREHAPDMLLQQLSVLISVALEPDQGVLDIGEKLGLTQASVSRNVAALSAIHRKHRPGLNLLAAYEDPMERRRKMVRLTPAGEVFVKKLAGAR